MKNSVTLLEQGKPARAPIRDIIKQLQDGKGLKDVVNIDGEAWGSRERSTLLLGLLDGVAQGSLQASLFVRCLKDMKYFNDSKSYYELGDIVWMTWLLHGLGSNRSAEERQSAGERLVEAAVNMVQEGLLSRQILMELSDGDFMEAAGLVNSYKDGWRKREIRLNTRNVYAQRKYNLLREESEGYSKVITLLNQSGAAKVSDEIMERTLTELKSLIGYFDLDPNRVSSLILDAFAAHPDNTAFVALIKGFGVYKCVEFLKFRFASGDGMHEGVFKSSALMVKSGLVSLEDIVGQLQPGDEEYTALIQARDVHLKQSVGKIGIISLASSEHAEDGHALRKSGQTAKTITLDTRSYRKILVSHYDVSESGDAGSAKNSDSTVDQRLEFLAELLACNAWEEALLFCKYLKKLGMVDIAAHDRIGRCLCRVIVEEIEENSSEISDKALEALSLVGCHLHFDLRALRRVLGVVSRMYSTDPERAQSILLETVLPAYNLIPANVELSTAFWRDLLAKLPYTERFCLYAEFEDVVKRSPLLQASEKLAETEIRRILRRVTAPTNKKEAKITMRPIARLLAKISHANPFVICRQLLRQVMGMPGMVLSISESLKYLTPLTFDVLTFTILKQLSSGKRKLKEDGVNLEEWFQWLALFTGVVCRNQHGMEVTSLVQYVVNQLKGSESMDLLVLREIISTMTRISPTVDVSNQQLDALAGSDALIQYVIGQEEGGRESGGKKDTVRATSRLVSALKQGSQNNHLLLPLLILLAQQRKLIALHPPSKHLKLAAELVDKCEEVTMQYIGFLQKSLPEAEYIATMPSIEDLMMEYKIDPEIVLQIHRPMLRKVAPCALSDGECQDEEGEIDTEHDGAEEGQRDHAPASTDWASVRQLMTKLAPGDGFVGMSWEMFVCFWAYELSDLSVPVERYDSVLKQVDLSRRNLQDDIAAKRDIPKGGHWGSNSGGAHMATPQVDVAALKAELASLDALGQVLPTDLEEQRRNATAVAWIFKQSSASWVKSKDIEAQAAAARELVQHCILPRLFLSPKDAMYCVEFLRQIHKLGPEGLRLLSVVDRLFKEIGFMVRCCTSRESTNLGIFLADLMSLVSQWRQKPTYEKECLDVEAFKSYKSGNLESVSYDEFIRLSANWHKRLTLDVFKSCIVSEDYMQMKNVLLVLNRMVRVYPATKEDAEELLATLKPISETDPREDLKTLARMYCTGLEMSIRDRSMVDSRQEYAGLPPPAKKRIVQQKEDAKQKDVKREAIPRKKAAEATDAQATKSEEVKKIEQEDPPKLNRNESSRKRDGREKQDVKKTKELTSPDRSEERGAQEESRRSAKPSSSSRRDPNREASRSGKDGRSSKRKQDDVSHQRRSSDSRSHDARNKRVDSSSKDNNPKRDSRQDSGKRDAGRKRSSKDDDNRNRDHKVQRRDEKEKGNERSKDRKLAKAKEPGEDFNGRSASERQLKRSRSADDSPPREQSKRSKGDGTRRRDRNDKSPDRNNNKPQQRSRHEARDKEQSYGSRQGRNSNMARQRSGGSHRNR